MMVFGERRLMMSGWRESSSLCLPRMRMSGVSFWMMSFLVLWRSQWVNWCPLSFRNRMRLPCQWSMKVRVRSSA